MLTGPVEARHVKAVEEFLKQKRIEFSKIPQIFLELWATAEYLERYRCVEIVEYVASTDPEVTKLGSKITKLLPTEYGKADVIDDAVLTGWSR